MSEPAGESLPRHPLLEFRDTAVRYRSARGPVDAVRGVNLTVDAGQTLGVAGESGSGKSTLAMTVLRLLPRTATMTGQVLLDGADVTAMSWGQLRAVRWADASVIFQGAMHALNPVRRVCDQIAEPMLLHGTTRGGSVDARVRQLLDRVGLPTRRARAYPHELSGGQRQRVMIAMALACDPRLVIADEPTTALDVMVQAQVLDLLAELVAERDVGLVMISHDLSVLARTCQRLAVMYAGRIVEYGPADQVVRHPTHPYTAALAAAFPTIGDPASRMAPRGLPGDPPDPAALPSGCPFHPRCAVARAECESTDVRLRPAGAGREAACVLVGEPTGVSS
ncbi:MAG TPA: ABC transporter ATP-binding protein [Pseudonocardiaceae bacterium]|jgi:peptide/nickel transport system ATP-binding protein|nr:ABC transporter ATP-binding protein [Pseudonocardiaceae bacterium]